MDNIHLSFNYINSLILTHYFILVIAEILNIIQKNKTNISFILSHKININGSDNAIEDLV